MATLGSTNNMKKLILIFAMFAPVLTIADTQTHNVYIHRTGIETSMYNTKQVAPDFSGLESLGKRFRDKRNADKEIKKEAEYSKELIALTNGFDNVTTENILYLLEKYPDKSKELMQILKRSK